MNNELEKHIDAILDSINRDADIVPVFRDEKFTGHLKEMLEKIKASARNRESGEIPEDPPKKAEDLYPGCNKYGDFWAPYSYEPIYNSFGEVIKEEDIGDYQGDTQVLLRDKPTGKYGYMMFGWGSCSMCDRLQGCDSYHDVNDLIRHLWSSVRWFDDDREAYNFFRNHEWKYDFGYSEDFVEFCTKFFKEKIEGSNADKD